MVAFIDQHRDTYGVEPICAQLPIAPSTYFLHKTEQRDPTRRSTRRRDDDERRQQIRRVWDEHQQVYGPKKVDSNAAFLKRREAVSIFSAVKAHHDDLIKEVGRDWRQKLAAGLLGLGLAGHDDSSCYAPHTEFLTPS